MPGRGFWPQARPRQSPPLRGEPRGQGHPIQHHLPGPGSCPLLCDGQGRGGSSWPPPPGEPGAAPNSQGAGEHGPHETDTSGGPPLSSPQAPSSGTRWGEPEQAGLDPHRPERPTREGRRRLTLAVLGLRPDTPLPAASDSLPRTRRRVPSRNLQNAPKWQGGFWVSHKIAQTKHGLKTHVPRAGGTRALGPGTQHSLPGSF